MYVTWLMMLGLFIAVSVLARFFLPLSRVRPFLLIAAGALLYYLMRELFTLHFRAMAVPEATIANPLLLGICAAFLCLDLSQSETKQCRTAGIFHVVPFAMFVLLYSIMSLATSNLSYWFPWFAGSVIIWYAGTCYRRSIAAMLVTAAALIIITWNPEPSLHAFMAGLVFIILIIVGTAIVRKERILDLLKVLKLSGLALIVAGKINPFGILWAQNLPFRREKIKPEYRLLVQLAGDIGLCAIGWLSVPFIVAPGYSAIHAMELAVMLAMFAFAAFSTWMLNRVSGGSKTQEPFHEVFTTDEAVLLLAGYLCFTGSLPVIVFLLAFVLFSVSTIASKHEGTEIQTELALLVNTKDDLAPVKQLVTVFTRENDSVPVFTETSGSKAEDILAAIIADMTHIGRTAVPRLVNDFVNDYRLRETGQEVNIIVSKNPGVLPVLTTCESSVSTYLLIPYKSVNEPNFRNSVIIGNAERPGKNGFASFKPLLDFFVSSHSVQISQLVAIGNISNTGSKSEPVTGLRYRYYQRQEALKELSSVKLTPCVFVFCDEAPGWPPADYRFVDSIAKALPGSEILLIFHGHKTGDGLPTTYPDIVTHCIERGQVCSFGSDSAMADAIKALLLQLFPGNNDEAEYMAGYFYPKAFQEPLMLDTGIMLLHTRSKKIVEPQLAIALSTTGWQHMAFKEPVRCILMLISPETLSAQEHLDNLASLAHAIRDMQLLKDLQSRT